MVVKRENRKAQEKLGEPQESDPEMTLVPGVSIAHV